MNAREREAARRAAMVLNVLGSHHFGAELPCGQHYSLGCALQCAAIGPCPWWAGNCYGPACWGRELMRSEERAWRSEET